MARTSRPHRKDARTADKAVAFQETTIAALGPRIYGTSLKSIADLGEWEQRLHRVAAMGFDWIYMGSFDASEIPVETKLNEKPDSPVRVIEGSTLLSQDEAKFRHFAERAQHLGIRIAVDFGIGHTDRDGAEASHHPDWNRKNSTGTSAAAPSIDPKHKVQVTTAREPAGIDYDDPNSRSALIDHWNGRLRRFVDLGIGGFRFEAAHKIPANVWRMILHRVKRDHKNLLFFADTLGCRPEELEQLKDVGFDYIFSSAKWWDFRSDWLLDQYERFRLLAPSIAFPNRRIDSGEIVGSATELERVQNRLKFDLLFSACFSTGLMVPTGYEFGFERPVGSFAPLSENGRQARIDLTEFVTALQDMKRSIPTLNREGQQRRITAPLHPIVGLLRLSDGHAISADECTITLLNPDEDRSHDIAVAPLLVETGGLFESFSDVTPMQPPVPFVAGQAITLEPLGVRVFRGERKRGEGRDHLLHPSAGSIETNQCLDELAAQRVAIERVEPELDGGRFPIKRVVGDMLEIQADIFSDGHDKLQARIKYRTVSDDQWSEEPMEFFDNDRWVGRIPLSLNTEYLYTVEAWRDLFGSWRADLVKRREAGQDLRLELSEGCIFIKKAADRALGERRRELTEMLEQAEALRAVPDDLADFLLREEVHRAILTSADRSNLSRFPRELRVIVDRQAAVYSAWYELLPRSQSGTKDRGGTFDDVIARLGYVRDMGFDVLYFPPIHPIGRTNRKGRNNSLISEPNDPGSPYAIGSKEGGHTAIHPELGNFHDFKRLINAAHLHGLEIALDFAIQCSPDHPWIKEHPEWFDWRPDGTIKFAENPPKKYEDIVNLHLYREAYPGAWHALKDVILFWVEHGVKIFRVDNPHTKPLPFWEWMIGEVRRSHPDVIFLAEAFTRPKMMKRLAKVGFSQSYTYFTWRTTKAELTEYLTELTSQEPKEYYRPNFFTNTPDINPFHLQTGGRPAFITRATLAATLSSVYGIYNGFELCEASALPGKEEYLDSEKYEIKVWDWDRKNNIRDHITKLNRIRRDNPALHQLANLRFYNAFNDNVLLYGKMTESKDNFLLIAVNLDPVSAQTFDFEAPLWEFGLPDDGSILTDELLSGVQNRWHGKIQKFQLDPNRNPCAVWRLSQPEAKK